MVFECDFGSNGEDACTLVEHVVCELPQEGRRSGWDQTLHERVAFDEELTYSGQGLTCEATNHRRRCLDQVSVVFHPKDGSERTRDLCAKCLTEHNVFRRSARSFRSEQARGRNK